MEIKDVNGEVIKAEGCLVSPFHAYISLMLGLLHEPFVSSDAKYLIIQSSYTYLRDMGYSEEEIEVYIEKIRNVVSSNIRINSFMG
jgi:hypothetical protein